MHYEVYKDAVGEWRWRLVAANNEILATSSEGYRNRIDALECVELVKNSGQAEVIIESGNGKSDRHPKLERP